MARAAHLRNGGVSVVVDVSGPTLPGIAHWGDDLGELDEPALLSVLDASGPAAIGQGPDLPVRLALLPEHRTGWIGRPGLEGSRADGSAWAPRFVLGDVEQTDDHGTQRLTLQAAAPEDGLSLVTVLELTPQGLLRASHTLHNTADTAYALQRLAVALPVPVRAEVVHDLTGRWARERSPQQRPFTVGTWLREARGGRTGPDSPTVLTAATPDLGFRRGEAWGIHLGWSGNSAWWADRAATGESLLSAGELLLAGELDIAPGGSYTTPWLFGSWSDEGLDGVSARIHAWLRARPHHPSPTGRPRPVTLNVWEAVYFDHDLDRLVGLAVVAKEVGVERFVLDDGWFRHRRDDTAGLGDWYVDEQVWPRGLHPLVNAVRGHGIEFGLWFEPEMVNPDSDLARAHPDWLLGASSGLPDNQRQQQVLDLGQQAVWDYLLERIDSVLTEYDIGYVKWDHNRQLIAASGVGGRAGVHRQTLAVYALLDELRRRHPGVEIESCSSGGCRIDLGILEHTDRVWTSDCNDALERQSIQRWTGLLLPPELMGAHVGPTRSHTTDRTHDLSFRGATALFGHFGIEWDISSTNPEEREELTEWVTLYRRVRHLLHTGTVVRGDSPDPAYWVHGVVAPDRSAAVYAFVRMATSVTSQIGLLQLPGLDPTASYRVRAITPGGLPRHRNGGERVLLAWLRDEGFLTTGQVLGTVGLQAPAQQPEHAMVLEVTRL
jgi:alpha-galactosidase